MKRQNRILILAILILFVSTKQAIAYSPRHHLINMGKNLVKFVGSPFYGLLVTGPKNVKEAYDYEVYGDEDRQKQALLRRQLFAVWRAPGEETKGLIDGLVDSASAAGEFLKNFLSIFFSD